MSARETGSHALLPLLLDEFTQKSKPFLCVIISTKSKTSFVKYQGCIQNGLLLQTAKRANLSFFIVSRIFLDHAQIALIKDVSIF